MLSLSDKLNQWSGMQQWTFPGTAKNQNCFSKNGIYSPSILPKMLRKCYT